MGCGLQAASNMAQAQPASTKPNCSPPLVGCLATCFAQTASRRAGICPQRCGRRCANVWHTNAPHPRMPSSPCPAAPPGGPQTAQEQVGGCQHPLVCRQGSTWRLSQRLKHAAMAVGPPERHPPGSLQACSAVPLPRPAAPKKPSCWQPPGAQLQLGLPASAGSPVLVSCLSRTHSAAAVPLKIQLLQHPCWRQSACQASAVADQRSAAPSQAASASSCCRPGATTAAGARCRGCQPGTQQTHAPPR